MLLAASVGSLGLVLHDGSVVLFFLGRCAAPHHFGGMLCSVKRTHLKDLGGEPGYHGQPAGVVFTPRGVSCKAHGESILGVFNPFGHMFCSDNSFVRSL